MLLGNFVHETCRPRGMRGRETAAFQQDRTGQVCVCTCMYVCVCMCALISFVSLLLIRELITSRNLQWSMH